ncbi:MAG: flagellar hook-length control protein FliK [Pseudomonadota bacterium]
MPNPITVSTAPQNTTATPETRHPDQPYTQPVVRFQDVIAAERTENVLVDQPVSPQEAADEAPEQADLVPENVTVDTAQSRPVNGAEQEQTDPETKRLDATDVHPQPTDNHTPDAAHPAQAAPAVLMDRESGDADPSPRLTLKHPIETIPAQQLHPIKVQLLNRSETGGTAPHMNATELPGHRGASITGFDAAGQRDNLEKPKNHPETQSGPPARAMVPSVAQIHVSAPTQVVEIDQTSMAEVETTFASADSAPRAPVRDMMSEGNTITHAARAEVARAISGQMAAAVQTRPGAGVVEITLNPEELGRVSIVLNGREDGLQMTIATERPETLELMRRHIAVLTAEFQRLGFGSLALDLGASSHGQPDHAPSETPSSNDAGPQAHEMQLHESIQRVSAGSGLDIRI